VRLHSAQVDIGPDEIVKSNSCSNGSYMNDVSLSDLPSRLSRLSGLSSPSSLSSLSSPSSLSSLIYSRDTICNVDDCTMLFNRMSA
jgi:hypothetical protein